MRFAEILVHPSPDSVRCWSTGLIQPAAPLLHAHTDPKIPKLLVRERPEQGVGVEEETERKDERTNKSYQLKSKQATEMITLKLFTPG